MSRVMHKRWCYATTRQQGHRPWTRFGGNWSGLFPKACALASPTISFLDLLKEPLKSENIPCFQKWWLSHWENKTSSSANRRFGLLYLRFNHREDLMKDLDKLANKRRWRCKRRFAGKALWNHTFFNKKHWNKRNALVQEKTGPPPPANTNEFWCCTSRIHLKMPRNAGILKDGPMCKSPRVATGAGTWFCGAEKLKLISNLPSTFKFLPSWSFVTQS